MKIRGIVVAAAATAVALAPLSAAQATAVGGDTVFAEECDVYVSYPLWENPPFGPLYWGGIWHDCDLPPHR